MMDLEHYKNEVRLTILNTEWLYNGAVGMRDLNIDGEEVDSLYMATWMEIMKNHGINLAPHLNDEGMSEVKRTVVEAVREVQA